MAVELAKMNVPKAVDGLDVQIIRDDAGLRVWANVFVNGYGLPPAWETSIYESWRHFGYDFPVRNYLGYLHGKPVSTSCLIFGGGAAGIYNVGTLPEARGRGLGAALTARPLLDARAMDYRIGTLQSSEMGFGVYQKLGFRHLCQIEYYFHANP
jgi:ribosomal protein S18 acetylase RimI-like enzyme